MIMPAKKKDKAVDIRDVNRVNNELLEEDLVLAATVHGVNEGYDMEDRERKEEKGPAAKRKARK